jgi:nicotinamidase-related amidase
MLRDEGCDMRTDIECHLHDGTRKALPDGDEALERWLEPGDSAVVSIDMHRGHIGPETVLPLPAIRARDRIAEHDAFHAAAREIGVPVIHVQHWQRHGGLDDLNSRAPNRRANWRVLLDLNDGATPLTDELNWEDTKWVDLMVEVDPRDLHVRTKKRLSAFYPSDLEFLLRQLDVHNVVLTGTYTDCCVLDSAFGAADRDFRVTVPADITAGFSAEYERHALGIISLYVGLVVDGPALLREWYARAGMTPPDDVARAQTMHDVVAARARQPAGR